MTSHGVTQFLQEKDCRLLSVPDKADLDKSPVQELASEFDVFWNLAEHSPLVEEQDLVDDLLAGHLESAPPDPDAEHEDEVASEASVYQPAIRVRLPCSNDPCVETIESSISSAKVSSRTTGTVLTRVSR